MNEKFNRNSNYLLCDCRISPTRDFYQILLCYSYGDKYYRKELTLSWKNGIYDPDSLYNRQSLRYIFRFGLITNKPLSDYYVINKELEFCRHNNQFLTIWGSFNDDYKRYNFRPIKTGFQIPWRKEFKWATQLENPLPEYSKVIPYLNRDTDGSLVSDYIKDMDHPFFSNYGPDVRICKGYEYLLIEPKLSLYQEVAL